MTPKAILLSPSVLLSRAPMPSHCRLPIPKAVVNSALLWSLIEGQFIISYPASEGMRKERKRVSHRFPDPAHTLLDLEMLVIGLVNFVFVNCGVCLRTAIWHNPQINNHPTCHQLLKAYTLQQSESYFATHGWHDGRSTLVQFHCGKIFTQPIPPVSLVLTRTEAELFAARMDGFSQPSLLPYGPLMKLNNPPPPPFVGFAIQTGARPRRRL